MLTTVSQLSRRQDELYSNLVYNFYYLVIQAAEHSVKIECLGETSADQLDIWPITKRKLRDPEKRLSRLDNLAVQPPWEVVWSKPDVGIVSEVTCNVNEGLELQNDIIFYLQESNNNVTDYIT